MLNALSIRDIVLIEKLDIALENGLTVLSGETGAGKSILLDALGLALGGRGDAAWCATAPPGAWLPPPSTRRPAIRPSPCWTSRGSPPTARSCCGGSRGGRHQPGLRQRPAGERRAAAPGRRRSWPRSMVSMTIAPCSMSASSRAARCLRRCSARSASGLALGFEALQAAERRWRSTAAWPSGPRRACLHRACRWRSCAPPRRVAGEEEKLARQRQLMMNAEQFADAVTETRRALDAEELGLPPQRRLAQARTTPAAGGRPARRADAPRSSGLPPKSPRRPASSMRRSARSPSTRARSNAPRSASSRSVRWPASTRCRSTRCRHCWPASRRRSGRSQR